MTTKPQDTHDEAYWKEKLSPEQYRVLRQGGTERPFTGEHLNTHADGKFSCAACGTQLFSSDTKFESGTGWPSFDQALPGAIGQRQTPGRVFPGKRMAGRLGADKVTKINLEVVKVDAERNLLLVKGAVPGSENGQLVVRPAVKIPAGK